MELTAIGTAITRFGRVKEKPSTLWTNLTGQITKQTHFRVSRTISYDRRQVRDPA